MSDIAGHRLSGILSRAVLMVCAAAVAAPLNGVERGLAGAYTDTAYLTGIPFGAHSHWLQPWRAYLETVPAAAFLDGIGINLHLHGEDPELIVRMLARNGVRTGRVEIGWGSIDWDDESRLHTDGKLEAVLLACKKYGVRPLILLNANQGAPVPMRGFERMVTADAAAGARQVQLDDAGGLVIGRSGLSNLSDYWAAEALITAIDGATVTLSKPLPKAIKQGTKVPLATFKYRPFGPPLRDESKETLAAWCRYAGTVARFVAATLGTDTATDRGFDMEIWNEMSFGSNFLNLNAYYQPGDATFHPDDVWGELVRGTIAHVEAHAADFTGVRFDDGFGNTLPWPASSKEPSRVVAIGKHPYSGGKEFPKEEQGGTRLNALGRQDEYVPTYHISSFPEYCFTALQTETMARDCAPIVNEVYGTKRGRYARSGNPCTVWVTEVGFAPSESGVTDHARQLALKAKTTARYLAFYLNKGVEKVWLFGAVEKDEWLGIVQDDFSAYAKTHHDYPAGDASFTSPALRVMSRLTGKMKDGLDPTLTATRAIRVDSICDDHDHAQFTGDGSAEHPPLYDREVLAILPYQVNAKRFVIPYYVMTRDVLRDLPPEDFSVGLSGVNGDGATVSAYDPINDRSVPVTLVSAAATTLTVKLSATDYPYLLIVQER